MIRWRKQCAGPCHMTNAFTTALRRWRGERKEHPETLIQAIRMNICLRSRRLPTPTKAKGNLTAMREIVSVARLGPRIWLNREFVWSHRSSVDTKRGGIR
jgi:hypothetical protein